jgi:hypothetical protein
MMLTKPIGKYDLGILSAILNVAYLHDFQFPGRHISPTVQNSDSGN